MKLLYLKYFILLAGGLFYSLFAEAQKKLLILGSSTSACAGPSSYENCYVGRLQKHYQNLGTPITIDNRAVGGFNPYMGMPTDYIPPPGRDLPRPYFNITAGLEGNPDVVLVNYPSNGYDIFSVEEVMFCLRTIKQTANSAGKPCYVTTTQPRSDPESYRTGPVRKKMAEIKDRVLEEFGQFAINFWDEIVNPADTTIRDIYNADGIHLNNEGHEILFNRVLEKNIFNQSQPDIVPPTVPGNLNVVSSGSTSISLDWDNSEDNVGVTGYEIYVNNVKRYTTSASNINADNLSPNTTYAFAVKAFDQAGNSSSFSNTVLATTTGTPIANGLKYRYYEGDWNSLPDFNSLAPIKMGETSNIDVSVRDVNDYFGFVWEGYINIPTTGVYTFELISDDGSKLYFDSFYSPDANALVSNDGLHPAESASGTVNITNAGLYPIAMIFFEKNGGEVMEVYWSGPGIPRQLIPDWAFVLYPSTTLNTKDLYLPDAIISATNGAELRNTGAVESEKENVHITKVYPNPFTDKLNINFYNTAGNNKIRVDIFDYSGRLVHNQFFSNVSTGRNMLRIDLSKHPQLHTGIYLIKLNVNGMPSKMLKLIKTKK